MKRILIILTIGVYLAAAGTLWMAYEQKRANSGIFIDPNALQAQPPTATPPLKSF